MSLDRRIGRQSCSWSGRMAWMMAIVCGSESLMAGVTKMDGSVIVLKVARFGKSLGVILLKAVSAHLHIAAGDTCISSERRRIPHYAL